MRTSTLVLGALLLSSWAHPTVASEPSPQTALRFDPAAFPLVRLSDEPAFEVGDLPAALAARLDAATPLALATCDLDDDGMPDGIVGWAGPGGNLLTIHRGNVDRLWPDTPEARQRRERGLPVEAPLLPDASALTIAARPELLACGELDGDGHPDLVAAARDEARLELLFGDGKGGIERERWLELSGPLSALAIGEVNRRDGLDDLVVGVGAGERSRLLVFAGPGGAATADPESFAALATVRSIVLGHFDDDWLLDIAAAAGPELLLVRGRDRKLTLDATRRAAVPSARVERYPLASEASALAAVDLEGRGRPILAGITAASELFLLDPRAARPLPVGVHRAPSPYGDSLVLVAARSFGHRGDDLVLADPAASQLVAFAADQLASALEGGAPPPAAEIKSPSSPIAIAPLRIDRDAQVDLLVLAADPPELTALVVSPVNTFVVDVTCEGFDHCPTLCDDANPGDGVCESIGGGCSITSAVEEAWYSAGPDTILLSVEPDGHCTQVVGFDAGHGAVTLDGSALTVPPYWQSLTIGESNCVLRGIEFESLAVGIQGNGTLVEGNVVHQASFASSNNTFGGTVATARNRAQGVSFTGPGTVGNVIEGNWIGTEDGSTFWGGGLAVEAGQDTQVGGTQSTRRNLIVAGGLDLGELAVGSLVQGNYIGTDVNGTATIGTTTGVDILAPGNTVGGPTVAARNVIVAATGVRVFDSVGPPETLIQGNLIGTDVTGTAAFGGSGAGIELNLASDVVIGGTTVGAGNLIAGYSASSSPGAVWIRGLASSDNFVLGNRIGTDLGGTGSLPNYRGIQIDGAAATTVGGSTGVAAGGPCSGACNVVASSTLEGIYVRGGSTDTVIAGNYIGTDVTGTTARPNGTGVRLDAADFTTVGGTDGVLAEGPCAGVCNLIAGSSNNGLVISNDSASCVVQGNFIGTDVLGTSPLGNGSNGISISASPGTTIGGDLPWQRNVIAASGLSAIRVSGAATVGTVVRRNLIGLGADRQTILGNGNYGVLFASSANNSTIGGLDPDQGNWIAGSSYSGVRAETGAGNDNAILSNRIWGSTWLAVDLGDPGVDANDPGDLDEGPNHLQNYPVLDDVAITPLGLNFQGALDSTPFTTYTIQVFANEVCAGLGNGEAQFLLGSEIVTTGSDGHVELALELLGAVALGQRFTATATDPDGNTSELSPCLSGPPGPDVRMIKSAPASASPGELVEFQLQIENVGTTQANGVTASDTLDGCLTEISCSSTRGSCGVGASTVSATLGDLQPLEAATVTISARLGYGCPAVLTNTASASTTGDINLANDEDSTATQVLALLRDGFESGDTSGWSSTVP